ncbi:hypothetical protein Clacol_004625 [Clathrus columnatus]|uniref:Phosphoglycerate mutase-like protein n=1 Tax=Clathrus columnatus TaxID=1419009 RepID=A0AAV5AB00_9AGAM|nr:hypothetical protein Clacol_004625 [Clathrus columnatus]
MKFIYKVIPDIFADIQDNDDPRIEQVLPRFGLLDTTPARWENLKRRISELNEAGTESSTTYRVLFIGRHGEGYHNCAMETYGREAWRNYWSKLMDKPWGPDPLLTDVGTEQAYNVNSIWKQELSAGIPIPEGFYSSPLSRAIQTALISFEEIAFPSGNNAAVAPKALIMEKLREGNYHQHTCNMRRTRSFIKETYPQFEIEEGFTEDDVFWNNKCTETEDSLRNRVREGLDEIFEKDKSWCELCWVSPRGTLGDILLFIEIFL